MNQVSGKHSVVLLFPIRTNIQSPRIMFIFPLSFHQTCEITTDNKNLLVELIQDQRKSEEWEKCENHGHGFTLIVGFKCQIFQMPQGHKIFSLYKN